MSFYDSVERTYQTYHLRFTDFFPITLHAVLDSPHKDDPVPSKTCWVPQNIQDLGMIHPRLSPKELVDQSIPHQTGSAGDLLVISPG